MDADLATPAFLAGVSRGHWRVVDVAFPFLTIAVKTTLPASPVAEYVFQFELSGFPNTPPQVLMWDLETNETLVAAKRPKGSPRINEAFKEWQAPHPVYRPWERTSGAHGDWATNFPNLAWNASRELTFILDDLHALLTPNDPSRS